MPPMQISNEVPRGIVDHSPLIERMKPEITILPAFRLAAHVVGEQASELDDGRGVLRSRDV